MVFTHVELYQDLSEHFHNLTYGSLPFYMAKIYLYVVIVGHGNSYMRFLKELFLYDKVSNFDHYNTLVTPEQFTRYHDEIY